MKEKTWFAVYITALVAGIQLYAWHCGHNGAVFAFTSFIIGAVAGTVMGFKFIREKDETKK